MYSWNSVKITRKIIFITRTFFRKGEKNVQGACCFTAWLLHQRAKHKFKKKKKKKFFLPSLPSADETWSYILHFEIKVARTIFQRVAQRFSSILSRLFFNFLILRTLNGLNSPLLYLNDSKVFVFPPSLKDRERKRIFYVLGR